MPDISEARLTTSAGIPYAIQQGYPKFGWDAGKLTGQEQYRIRATDIAAFISELTPAPIIIGTSIRISPVRFMPGTSFLSPKSMEFEPFNTERPGDPFLMDPRAPEHTYEQDYRVTINYETNEDSDEDSDRNEAQPETFLQHSISSSFEMLVIQPNAKLKTEEVDDPTDPRYGLPPAAIDNPHAPVTKLIPLVEHSLKWKRVLSPDFNRIFGSMGTVNGGVYPFLLNAPEETCMFMGISGSQEYQNLGAKFIIKPWELEFKFARRQITDNAITYGWNHIYNPDTHKFERLLRTLANGNTIPLYPSGNFLNLFKQKAA